MPAHHPSFSASLSAACTFAQAAIQINGVILHEKHSMYSATCIIQGRLKAMTHLLDHERTVIVMLSDILNLNLT